MSTIKKRIVGAINRQLAKNVKMAYPKLRLLPRKMKVSSFRKYYGKKPTSYRYIKGKCRRMEKRKKRNMIESMRKTKKAYYYRGIYYGSTTDKNNNSESGNAFINQAVGSNMYINEYIPYFTTISYSNIQQYSEAQGRVFYCPYWPINAMQPIGPVAEVANTIIDSSGNQSILPRSFALIPKQTILDTNIYLTHSLNRNDVNVQREVTPLADYTPIPPWTICMIDSYKTALKLENVSKFAVEVHIYIVKLNNVSGFGSFYPTKWERIVNSGLDIPGIDIQRRSWVDYMNIQNGLPSKFFKILKHKKVYLGGNFISGYQTVRPSKTVVIKGKNVGKVFSKTGGNDSTDWPNLDYMFTEFPFENWYILTDIKRVGTDATTPTYLKSAVSMTITKYVKYYLK